MNDIGLTLRQLLKSPGFTAVTVLTLAPHSESPISLSALEHNLELKVARFKPEIARQNLSAAYGAYEPAFGVGGTHSYKLEV